MSLEDFARMRSVSAEEWRRGLIQRDASLSWVGALPALPSDDVQRAFTGKSHGDAFEQAFAAVERFVSSANELGFEVTEHTRLLDFGCGWGRITQAAYRYVSPDNIIAADVQQNALDICSSTGLAAELLLVDDNRVALPDQSVDLAFAYSVFSHLNEKAHLHWLTELHRVLVPGGCLAVTTRGANMIQHVQNLSCAKEINASQARLVEAFGDPDAMLADLNRGEFVFRPYPSPAANLSDEYGEAFIPESYARTRWAGLFPGLRFTPPDHRVDQAVIVARK